MLWVCRRCHRTSRHTHVMDFCAITFVLGDRLFRHLNTMIWSSSQNKDWEWLGGLQPYLFLNKRFQDAEKGVFSCLYVEYLLFEEFFFKAFLRNSLSEICIALLYNIIIFDKKRIKMRRISKFLFLLLFSLILCSFFFIQFIVTRASGSNPTDLFF